jgi:hypothetical protein
MISAFEQEPITVREQRADLPPAQAEPARLPRPVNGFHRNHVAVSGPQIIVARERDHCSQAEVAARLGCTVKAVETRLYHGRKRLGAELQNILNPWRCRVESAIRPQTSRRSQIDSSAV